MALARTCDKKTQITHTFTSAFTVDAEQWRRYVNDLVRVYKPLAKRGPYLKRVFFFAGYFLTPFGEKLLINTRHQRKDYADLRNVFFFLSFLFAAALSCWQLITILLTFRGLPELIKDETFHTPRRITETIIPTKQTRHSGSYRSKPRAANPKQNNAAACVCMCPRMSPVLSRKRGPGLMHIRLETTSICDSFVYISIRI